MLHKAMSVRGFHLHARDGEIGHVEDFLFDDQFGIRFLVVDTSNWIGGRSVLIAPSVITRVDSVDSVVHVALTRDEIKRAPSVENADIVPAENLPTVWIM